MRMHLFFFLIVLLIFSSLSHASNSSSCPIDFRYVNTFTFPWDPSECISGKDAKNCCSSLTSLFGIGLSQYLRKNKTFLLPNSQTSTSCISDFQSHLSLIPDVQQTFSSCITSSDEFVASPSSCSGIMTVSDWVEKVGPTPKLDYACNGDLSKLQMCADCVDAGLDVLSQSSLNKSSTACFMLVVLYAGGIINSFGPDDIRTAECIFGQPLFTFTSESKSISRSQKTIIFAISGAFAGSLVVVGVILIYIRCNYKKKENQIHIDYVRDVKARVLPKSGAKWFQIAELEAATKGFSQRNLIGQGGFGVVYKGTLSDGTLVAVKKMRRSDTEEGDNDFVNEAEIISMIRHRNLLPLRGFCATSDPINETERYLVYEFMSNGSLHDHIFEQKGSRKRLSWPQRKSIIIDSHMTTRIVGTYGYVAPEYALYGQLTEKSDVYSFGIIVLEIMSGRKVLEEVNGVNSGMVLIADWAWELVKSGRIEEVFDSSMRGGSLPKSVMSRFVRVGLLCAHVMVAIRPTISEALKMLEGDIDIPRLPDRPPPLGHESSRSSFEHSN
ncbi:hypothetical protein M8C21_019436, partial [Ambrosia artemisiifolia]